MEIFPMMNLSYIVKSYFVWYVPSIVWIILPECWLTLALHLEAETKWCSCNWFER